MVVVPRGGRVWPLLGALGAWPAVAVAYHLAGSFPTPCLCSGLAGPALINIPANGSARDQQLLRGPILAQSSGPMPRGFSSVFEV